MDTPLEFFSWLASQSAFVEVVIGVFFCLVVAPARWPVSPLPSRDWKVLWKRGCLQSRCSIWRPLPLEAVEHPDGIQASPNW